MNEKIQVVYPQGQDKLEILIREVTTVNELPVFPPVKVAIIGTITAVTNFLEKRITEIDQVDQKRCMIFVDREEKQITLVTNENDHYSSGKVTGKLSIHPALIAFGINQKKELNPIDLGQFFKMNRFYFADKSENMNIVSSLMNLKTKVDVSIEKQKCDNGSFADNYSGIVSSNLPGTFKLIIPLFKGMPAEIIDVEIYASVNGRNISLQLISPGACQAMEEISNTIIDSQIEAIRTIAPDIAIIEI